MLVGVLEKKFIVVDWGTSNMRLFLCERATEKRSVKKPIVLDRLQGPGIGDTKNAENAFFQLAADWLDRYPDTPVFMSGMVGSNIGWVPTPYLDCPISILDIGQGKTEFFARKHKLYVQHGLSCLNSMGLPDLMRGEELQILGWYKSNPGRHARGSHLICLPGTHSKWVSVKDGVVIGFSTAVTGELYEVLLRHSVLVCGELDPGHQEGFRRGLSEVYRCGGEKLVSLLFSVRARQLVSDLDASSSAAYMSGLLIGADVLSAVGGERALDDGAELHIIGSDQVSGLYKQALELKKYLVQTISSEEACFYAYAETA